MGKVKFGLSNVHYAIATIANDGSATYGEVKAFPGAVSLSMEPQTENYTFYADNYAYFTNNTYSGYEGDFEVALVIDDFKKDVLGDVESGDLLVEKANPATVHFALMFQFENDVNATRHVFYNCTASRANVEGDTKEENIEVKTETLNLRATSIYNAAVADQIVKAECKYDAATTSTYQKFFDAVSQPV